MAGILIHRALPPSECVLPEYGFRFVQIREGYVGYAYDDADGERIKTFITPENAHTVRGTLTLGHGRTKGVKPGDTCTPAEAEQWLRDELAEDYEPIVKRVVKVPLAPYQYAALVSIVYNRGLIPPSLLACINGGKTDAGVMMAPCSWSEAIKQFPRNCRSTILQSDMQYPIKLKQPLEGLYSRRLAEAVMFAGLREWDLATAGVQLIARRIRAANGEWKYEIDTNETTSLESVMERAARAASVEGLPPALDEDEAQPDPASREPVAARETAQPPSPPSSSPSVPEPQDSAPAVMGEGADATAIAAPPPNPDARFPAPAGPVAGAGSVGGTIVYKSPATVAPPPADDRRELDKAAINKRVAESLMIGGTFIRAITGNSMKLGGVVAGFLTTGFLGEIGKLMALAAENPAIMAALVASLSALVVGALWLFGVVMDKVGLWLKKRTHRKLEERARQAEIEASLRTVS